MSVGLETGSVYVSSVDELKEAMSNVESGETIHLSGNVFVLSESLWIEQHDVHLRGESPEVTILVCPEDDSILNIA